MRVSGWMAALFLLAYAVGAARAQAPAPAPAPVPAADSYSAATTYAKLAPAYPFIRIASSAVPANVRAVTDATYVRYGARALRLDLYLPARPAPSPSPAIVFVHGGGWRVGTRAEFAPMAIRMAQRGYAAAVIDYRLSGEAPYPAAVRDAKAALRWLRAHARDYAVDPGRIAIAGGSAGGQIAALAGVTNGIARFEPDADSAADAGADAGADTSASSAAQAIVNIDGLSDFTSAAVRRYEDAPDKPSAAGAWLGGRYADKPALWADASPLAYVNAATPPMLFIGSAQPRFSLGRDAMVARLDAAGVAEQVVLLPQTPHSFWMFDPWLAPTVEATVRFLDAQMKGAGR